MVYKSQINFTFDTICPWTYLAKKRLTEALRLTRAENPAAEFVLALRPFQLYPDLSKQGVDKKEWYKNSRYGDSEEKMEMYIKIMSSYGQSCGIGFKFGGVMANTLDAHRVIQYWQEERGHETAEKILDSLYFQFFEEEKHPSAASTLLTACKEAGIPEEEAKRVIEDESVFLQDIKSLLQEQKGNGVDAVPVVVVEGKKRDFTLQGTKEVPDYIKVLNQVIKES